MDAVLINIHMYMCTCVCAYVCECVLVYMCERSYVVTYGHLVKCTYELSEFILLLYSENHSFKSWLRCISKVIFVSMDDFWIYIYIFIYIYIYIYIYICIYIYIYMCVCMCVYVCERLFVKPITSFTVKYLCMCELLCL